MKEQGCLNQHTSRMNVLDIAKGIGIVFVIFAHVNYTPELLTPIYSFHMPLFFILAGMVYNPEKYPRLRDLIRRRWDTMIKAYLFFSLAALVYVFLSEKIFVYAKDLSAEKYISSFWQIFIAQGSAPVLNTPLWFVPCLFAVELMYFYLARLTLVRCVLVCAVLSSAGWLLESGLLAFNNKVLPWTLDSALYALSFYAAGNRLFPYVRRAIIRNENRPDRNKRYLAVFALCVLVWLPLMLMNGKVSLGSRVLNNGFLFFLTGVLGTLAVLAVSCMLKDNKFLLFLGKNTFCLMSVHFMIRAYTIPKYYKMLGIPLYKRKVFAQTIVPFLLVFALSIAVTVIYRAVQQRMAQARGHASVPKHTVK